MKRTIERPEENNIRYFPTIFIAASSPTPSRRIHFICSPGRLIGPMGLLRFLSVGRVESNLWDPAEEYRAPGPCKPRAEKKFLLKKWLLGKCISIYIFKPTVIIGNIFCR